MVAIIVVIELALFKISFASKLVSNRQLYNYLDWGNFAKYTNATWLLRFVLNLHDNFLARRNILATNRIARKTSQPFENNKKRSQGRLGEGGPLNGPEGFAKYSITRMSLIAINTSSQYG